MSSAVLMHAARQPRFAATRADRPAEADERATAVPADLTPRTGPHDLYVGKRSSEHNGVTKLDIKPLHEKNDWFRIDDPDTYRRQIAQKKVLLQNHRDVVSATLPEGEAGARELLETMAEYLPQTFPQYFRRDGRVLTNKLTGDVVDLDHLKDDPINVAAMLVQEDLVLIHQDGKGRFRVSAGSLCFPSGWSLREKLGKTIMETHRGVTLLNKFLGRIIDGFLNRMKPEKQYWRINFLTSSSPRLTHLPEVPEEYDYYKPGPVTADNVQDLYLRNERELFTRMPQSGDILFSLKTYITPFPELPKTTAAQLADLIGSLPARFSRQYRDWTPTEKKHVIHYLRQLAGQASPAHPPEQDKPER